MQTEFEKAITHFSDHLRTKMGEGRATSFLNKFIQIPSGDKLTSLVEALILYSCSEYGISREALLYSTKMIHCYARITCYHILQKHLKISVSNIASLFSKKKKDSVIDGVEKVQGLLDIPTCNPDFVSKYKSIEKQYINFTEFIHDAEESK